MRKPVSTVAMAAVLNVVEPMSTGIGASARRELKQKRFTPST